jgi:hypothetical protein
VVVFVQTPPPPSSAPAPPTVGGIQAQFAAQVAARMGEPSQSEGRNAQGPVPTTGNNVAGSESKPQDTASSANPSRQSSEEAKGGKKVEVSVTTGHVVAKESTTAPVTTVTTNEPATKSGSRELLKEATVGSISASSNVPGSKGLSADAPSFEMRPQVAATSVARAANANAASTKPDTAAAATKPDTAAATKPDTAAATKPDTVVPVIEAPVVEVPVNAAVTQVEVTTATKQSAAASSDAAKVEASALNDAKPASTVDTVPATSNTETPSKQDGKFVCSLLLQMLINIGSNK